MFVCYSHGSFLLHSLFNSVDYSFRQPYEILSENAVGLTARQAVHCASSFAVRSCVVQFDTSTPAHMHICILVDCSFLFLFS